MEFDGVADAARGSDGSDQGQDQVFRGHSARELTVDTDLHWLHSLHRQALRREHVLDVGGTDAECQGGERPVRAGMRIPRHNAHARQRCALLGADDVDDALAVIVESEFSDREIHAIARELLDLRARHRISDPELARGGRHIMVCRRQRCFRPPHLPSREPQALKRLRTQDFVKKVPIDIDECRAVGRFGDDMPFP